MCSQACQTIMTADCISRLCATVLTTSQLLCQLTRSLADYDDEEIGSEDADGWDDDLEDSAEGATDDATRLANRRRGKGTGNPGKPGKKLRLADLQSQFGVGLKV